MLEGVLSTLNSVYAVDQVLSPFFGSHNKLRSILIRHVIKGEAHDVRSRVCST